ncbi:MAG TPA: hypothetical protein VE028_12980 [Nitratidesulfovibrio sp.]|nr:hypothetical protein [Nitratidesulfovibrio sp.]
MASSVSGRQVPADSVAVGGVHSFRPRLATTCEDRKRRSLAGAAWAAPCQPRRKDSKTGANGDNPADFMGRRGQMRQCEDVKHGYNYNFEHVMSIQRNKNVNDKMKKRLRKGTTLGIFRLTGFAGRA